MAEPARKLVTVAELLRFEGESDPQDESIVLALRSRDGRIRGILIEMFGPAVDPRAGELIRRLPPPLHLPRPTRGKAPSAGL